MPRTSYLALEGSDEDPMDQLRGHSITYRIAAGPQQGRKVFTLQTLTDVRDADETPATGNVAGFSPHATVAAKANQCDKLERLCRYITRPAIAEKRLQGEDFSSLPNIEFLIDGNGDITIGAVGPIACAPTAVDEDQCLAILVRRDGETLQQLLLRLERSIESFYSLDSSESMETTTRDR